MGKGGRPDGVTVIYGVVWTIEELQHFATAILGLPLDVTDDHDQYEIIDRFERTAPQWDCGPVWREARWHAVRELPLRNFLCFVAGLAASSDGLERASTLEKALATPLEPSEEFTPSCDISGVALPRPVLQKIFDHLRVLVMEGDREPQFFPQRAVNAGRGRRSGLVEFVVAPHDLAHDEPITGFGIVKHLRGGYGDILEDGMDLEQYRLDCIIDPDDAAALDHVMATRVRDALGPDPRAGAVTPRIHMWPNDCACCS